ncbi:hypothetical protein [Halotalea alkalilenta]|uniref:hypothetical protein n=1 Tax=Halotalea alkalilenta TaxID=376489 RepID=UPI0004844D50|nr:hypothetical protein [Halotalea alkalilenta]
MYNRQLHPEERRLIKEEAARLQEAHGSAGPLDWETMLTLAAGNRLDADNADTFARLEAQVASDPNNPLAQQFQQAMTVANATIEVLAGQNVLLQWQDGTAIQAYGDPVLAFQASERQRQDAGLFNAPGFMGPYT